MPRGSHIIEAKTRSARVGTLGSLTYRLSPTEVSRRSSVILVVAALCLVGGVWSASRGSAANNPPVLISQATSTRAIALESVTFLPEPFALMSPFAWGPDRRTRVMLFAMNITLQPGEDLSLVSADAEDAAHRHYALTVEQVSPVPSHGWMSAVILRLSDDLLEVGDVLVSVSYRGRASNRVRLGIGHVGGGPPDDDGATPTPAPPYTISGRVTADNLGLGGVTVTLSGTQAGMQVTNENGFYSFTITAVGDYVLAASKPFYNVNPPVRSLVNLNGHRLNLDFNASRQTFTISGQVRDDSNQGLAGVEVTLTNETLGTARTVMTSDGGGFSLSDVPAGYSFAVTPSNTNVFAFNAQSIDALAGNQTLDFSGTRRRYSISGKIADQNGSGLPGITVRLSGAVGATLPTNDSGHYEFLHLPAGHAYAVTPVSTANYTFTARAVPDLSTNQTVDITGLWRFPLSGSVRDASGNGLPGITITLAGAESATTTTGGDGSYSLHATATWNHTLTPSIAQSYYNFAPSHRQLNNLAGAQTTDFTATLAPLPNPSHVLEFDGSPKTVDYGFFWEPNVHLGHFFWEFWAMPGSNAAATYMLSDGYGGAHALLFGFASLNTSEAGRYQLFGNIFNGITHENYFSSDQGPAPGEWGHFAVGWDGQNIHTYFNGVPVGKAPFAGPRLTPGPGGGGGRLLIGGSDHSNFDGRIAQVRGYEGSNPREGTPGSVETSFAPESVFGSGGNLLSYYFTPAPRLVADLSRGYEGSAHTGFLRGTSTGIINYCETCPPPQFVLDPSAPNFDAEVPSPPVHVQPPLPVPGGALVFDSFSRANSTYVFGGNGGLGSTEWGTEGAQVWQTNQSAGSRQPFGILNGRAVLLGNAAYLAWVPTSSSTGNLDVRVNRHPGSRGSGIHTGLSFRVMDARNFFFAYTGDGEAPNAQVLTVGYYINGHRIELAGGVTMPANWTTLRVVTRNLGTIEVYAGSVLVYSTNSSVMSTVEGAGLYNHSSGLGLVNRWDNFTVFNAQ